jgi:hypothetical protein
VKTVRSVALAVTLAVLLSSVQSSWPTTAHAQPSCQFNLGFAALREVIASIVGDCLETEHFEPSTGNSIQKTTGGLLVWRKADNWTAFTDGAFTWVMGPSGLAQRAAGGPYFPWEAPPTVVAAPSSPPESAPPPPPVAASPPAQAAPAAPRGDPWLGDLTFSYDQNGSGAVPPGGKLPLVGGGTVYAFFKWRNVPSGSRISWRIDRDKQTTRTGEHLPPGPDGNGFVPIVQYANPGNTGRQMNFILATWEIVVSLNGREMLRGSITPS